VKGLLVFAVLLVSVSAISRLDKLRHRNRWDIFENLTGAGAKGKVVGHERSVREAYALLTPGEQAHIHLPALSTTSPPIITGVQYPDMPIGGAAMQQLGDDLTAPDHVNVATFGTFFLAGEATGDTSGRHTFVSQTHFGCLQFWHAMAPEPYIDGTHYKQWTNGDLSSLIKNAMQRIWGVMVAHVAHNRPLAEFHLGRILHTIGDSFAKGHTVRGETPACGPIFVFQEYNAQKGNKAHDGQDKPDNNRPGFTCTVNHIHMVMQHYAACVAAAGVGVPCAYPPALDAIFNIDNSVALKIAGGAIAAFAADSVKASPDKDSVTVPDSRGLNMVWDVYYPPRGTRTIVHGTAVVAQACPNF